MRCDLVTVDTHPVEDKRDGVGERCEWEGNEMGTRSDNIHLTESPR